MGTVYRESRLWMRTPQNLGFSDMACEGHMP